MSRSERLWKEGNFCDTRYGRCWIVDSSAIHSLEADYWGTDDTYVNSVLVTVDLYFSRQSQQLYGRVDNAAEWDAVRAHVARS